ncbi:MAG: P-type conjugative transfer protein TrbJ [Halothiobacillaceae bacterium]
MEFKLRATAVAIVIATPLTFLSLPAAYAGGGAPAVPVDATEITQLANNLELAASVAKEAEQVSNQLLQIQNQIQAYKDMVTNTLNIPNQIWAQADGLLNQLVGIVNQGQALAFSATNINDLFKLKYPGYTPPQDFGAAYRDISDETLKVARDAAYSAGLQMEDLVSEESVMKALETQSKSAKGRMQAIEAGNAIALAQVQQTRKLRAIQAEQLKAQSAYTAGEEQKKVNEEMLIKETLNFTVTPLDKSPLQQYRP